LRKINDKAEAGKMLKDDRDKEAEPIEASLTRLKKRITFLLIKKDKVIPWHEKLPKDNQYCMYFLQKCNANKLKTEVEDKADNYRNLFRDVGENLHQKAERAARTNRFSATGGIGRGKKRSYF